MGDSFSEMIPLLRPCAVGSRAVTGSGKWGRYGKIDHNCFAVILEGGCRFAVGDEAPLTMMAGDVSLLLASSDFAFSSLEPAVRNHVEAASVPPMTEHYGAKDSPPDFRLLGGWFTFDSPNADLLTSFLPKHICVRRSAQLSSLIALIDAEAREQRPGRDLALNRLVEAMLIIALRESAESEPAGLLRGLADPRIMPSIRAIHGDPARNWTVSDLANVAALSRSAFFDRFMRVVGMSPMDYLLAWRMAVAKDLLQNQNLSLDDVADRVGYSSSNTFTTAFRKHVGVPPRRYAREHIAAQPH